MKKRRPPINYQRTLHLPAAIIFLIVLLGTAQAATATCQTPTTAAQARWKGTCRILVVRLSDGTDHSASGKPMNTTAENLINLPVPVRASVD